MDKFLQVISLLIFSLAPVVLGVMLIISDINPFRLFIAMFFVMAGGLLLGLATERE